MTNSLTGHVLYPRTLPRIHAVQVTPDNLEKIAEWTMGELHDLITTRVDKANGSLDLVELKTVRIPNGEFVYVDEWVVTEDSGATHYRMTTLEIKQYYVSDVIFEGESNAT